MSASRELIEATLFAKLENCADFKSASRRFKLFDDVAAADQPALLLVALDEEAKVTTGLPIMWHRTYECWIYVKTGGDETQSPSQILNPLLDAVETALLPPPGQGKQTLGNLVHRCSIEGKIEKFLGPAGDQAIATIPVTVIIPQDL